MTLIRLERCKQLFRDKASYLKFIQLFRDAFNEGQMPMVMEDDSILFAAISQKDAKDMLANRSRSLTGENPLLLDDLGMAPRRSRGLSRRGRPFPLWFPLDLEHTLTCR